MMGSGTKRQTMVALKTGKEGKTKKIQKTLPTGRGWTMVALKTGKEGKTKKIQKTLPTGRGCARNEKYDMEQIGSLIFREMDHNFLIGSAI
jgi:hypothetical protein